MSGQVKWGLDLSKDEAVRLFDSGWWKNTDDVDCATIQINCERLIMPFGEFQRCMEKALGRSVWTHEFANRDGLLAELSGDKDAPSMEEIIAMLPADKVVLLEVGK